MACTEGRKVTVSRLKGGRDFFEAGLVHVWRYYVGDPAVADPPDPIQRSVGTATEPDRWAL